MLEIILFGQQEPWVILVGKGIPANVAAAFKGRLDIVIKVIKCCD